ncbi:class I SAM-dependent methyltransferase [Mycolicibacterium diernhoferi]|uniref:class I SAM-dependent methyltransferase n=1 Tax=Mycolicibacterium diernhoferi TaxID=1801 RepID=UPI0013F66F68|nr:class I SAM-dependent methyltransferase [Mycolicibacterium diernhoferi]QYL23741.1 class I SAM-dependent methyltransferase [Mycolicibacterium diernhoferi]
MKDTWQQTKFSINGATITASKDANELAPSSRIVASLVADFYQRTLPKWVSGDLVDLGCGKAPLLGAYREHCSSIVLADWANSLHENPLLDIVIDLNKPLQAFENESFDVVVLSDVLEHIAEPSNLLSEISRILKPGGRLILNVPFLYQLHETPHDYFRYTQYALDRLIEKAGLEVKELVPLGGWLEVMADLWSKLLLHARLSILVPALHRLVMAVRKTPVGRRFTDKTSRVFPIGYGLVAVKVQRLEEI